MKVDTSVKVVDTPYFHTPNGKEGKIVFIFDDTEIYDAVLYQVQFDYYAAIFREKEIEEIKND